MKQLDKQQLLNINGGAISATFINAIARGISTLVDLGRNLGSAVRRLYSGRLCKI